MMAFIITGYLFCFFSLLCIGALLVDVFRKPKRK